MLLRLYSRVVEKGHARLRPEGGTFKLGGKNLLFTAWEMRQRPIGQGWHVSAAELISLHTKGLHSHETRRLVIDLDQSGVGGQGVHELLDIYAFACRAKTPGEPLWTPLMLRLRELSSAELHEKPDAKISEPKAGHTCIELMNAYLSSNGCKFVSIDPAKAEPLPEPAVNYLHKFKRVQAAEA